jgi:capsule polysaccharide export protein KpsE/RkpR
LAPLNNKDAFRVLEPPPETSPANGHPGSATGSAEESRRVAWARLLWEERRFLRRVTLRGFVLALAIALLLPSRYQSTTRLMPPDQQSGSGLAMLAAFAGRGSGSGNNSGVLNSLGGALGGSLGNMAGDLLGLKSSGALFIDMLNGPTIQDSLIQKFDLRKIYWDRYWEDARKDLAKHTDVKEDRKSGVITLQVTDSNPQRARQMAQAYVDALNGLVAQVSTSSARRERMFIEQRLKAVKQNLDNAMQDFSEFASKNGTFDMPSQTKAMVESEASLQGDLIAAQSELEGLRQVYTDNNIRVRSLQARVAELKQQVEKMSGNKADLDSADSGIPGDFPSIRKLPLVGVRWANLYRETKIQETVYELLTQEYEVAKIQEAKEIPTVNVLDPPTAPEEHSFPPRTVITVLGTFLALLFAGAYVVGTAAWKQHASAEKQLATEIWSEMEANQSTPRAIVHRCWAKLGGKNGSHNKAA